MDKKKIYIAGCGGMLGEAFYQQFKDDYIIKCTDKDVNAEWLSFLDFRDYDAYKKDVEEFLPDYLFHLGAYTDLEWCEQNADEVYLCGECRLYRQCTGHPSALYQYGGHLRWEETTLRRLGSSQSAGSLRALQVYG